MYKINIIVLQLLTSIINPHPYMYIIDPFIHLFNIYPCIHYSSICPSIYNFINPTIKPSIHQSVDAIIHSQSIHPYPHPSIYIYLCIDPPTHHHIHQYIHLSTHNYIQSCIYHTIHSSIIHWYSRIVK